MKKFFYIIITLILVCCLTLLPCSAYTYDLEIGSGTGLAAWNTSPIAGSYVGTSNIDGVTVQKWRSAGFDGSYSVSVYGSWVVNSTSDTAFDANAVYTCVGWKAQCSAYPAQFAYGVNFYDGSGSDLGGLRLVDGTLKSSSHYGGACNISFRIPEGCRRIEFVAIMTAEKSFTCHFYGLHIKGVNETAQIQQSINDGVSDVNQHVDEAVSKGVDDLNNAGSDEPPLDTDISAFQSAIDTMNGWLAQLDEFANTIDTAGQTAHEYISQGSDLITGFLGVAPAAVIALVAFGVVFIVVRKIVGR